MRSLALLFTSSISIAMAWSPQFIDGIDKAYTCNCALREDLRQKPVMVPEEDVMVAPPTDPSPPMPIGEELNEFQPNRYWSLYNGHLLRSQRTMIPNLSFLERVMTMFRVREGATTVPPTLPPQSDAASDAIAGLGKRIVLKYMDKLRQDWNVLDRFECHCEGELLDVLQARNYVSLKITHD